MRNPAAGDLVRCVDRLGGNEIDRFRRWSKKGIFDAAKAAGIPLSVPRKGVIYLVLDDICLEMIRFIHDGHRSDLLGVRFVTCHSPETGRVVLSSGYLEIISEAG